MSNADETRRDEARPAAPAGPGAGLHVRELAVYPVKGEPGELLQRAEVEAEGLAGDRRKKRPVHLVAGDETPQTTRANVFLDGDPTTLAALVGEHVRVGAAELLIEELPSGCPGVYASVVTPGQVALGDDLTTAT